ncbi:MAG: VTT domain-containing protein [Chloroflexi bacterium]|nr:VTT domain-containing protein [Chloroflexota bacterium]
MSGIDITALALGWIAAYGSPMVAGMLFLGGLGVPVPATLIVIASGAFMRQNLLDLYSTPVFGYIGTIIGDATLYSIGYFASARIEARFGETAAWKSARELFTRRGGIAIFLTRWLLTAVALPTTLIAGSSGYRFRKFFMFVMLGELTWVLIYGGLGYAFGSQWELISDFISNFSGFILGALALGVGIYLLVRFGKKPVKPA